MKSFKWRKEKPTKGWVYPTSREGHTITYISKHNIILLFGGISNQRMNDLYLYDIKENMWKTQVTTGRSPSARCFHTAFYDDSTDSYFIYGGQGDKGRSMGDFYIMSLKNWIWKKLFIQEIPPTRHHHILAEMNNETKERLIFGGICQPENQLLNDLWIFNYKNLLTSSSLQDISGGKVVEINAYGEAPSPRIGMCTFSIDKCMFIFGGQSNNKDEETNTLYCLSFDTWNWTKIQGIGQPPPSRSFMSASVYTNRRVIFFGGVDNETSKATNEVTILTLNDYFWSTPFQAGIKASPRYHHSTCMVEASSTEKFLVILGGLDFTFCPMELCILYEEESNENLEWEKLQEPNDLDLITQEKAGLTIFEMKQHISELNEKISQERMKSQKKEVIFNVLKYSNQRIQLEDTHQKLDQKLKSSEKEHIEYTNSLEQELSSLENQQEKYKQQIETMCVLIKQEQLYSQEQIEKNKLLEFTIQKIQDYLVPLDQFYSTLMQSNFDEKDSKEMKLKLLVNGSKDDVIKARDQHKESLYKLKKSYEKINDSIKKSDQTIANNRKNILNINKEYGQVVCETEIEENI